MTSPRTLLTKTALAVALLFACVDSAEAVRPYTTRYSEHTFYRRPTNTPLTGYTIAPRKSTVSLRMVPYKIRQHALTPLKSWSGLGNGERRLRGDQSGYGDLRSRSHVGHDPAVRHGGSQRLRVTNSPLSVR